jgi:hypothetical protein
MAGKAIRRDNHSKMVKNDQKGGDQLIHDYVTGKV